MKKTKSLCVGCYNNFYNGNNPLGVAECWSFKDAKVVKRAFVHLNDVPPWHVKPETTLDCHSRPRFVSIKPEHSQLMNGTVQRRVNAR